MTSREANTRLQAEFPDLKIVRVHCGFELRDTSLEKAGIPQQWRYGLQKHTVLLGMARAGKVPTVASWAVKAGSK